MMDRIQVAMWPVSAGCAVLSWPIGMAIFILRVAFLVLTAFIAYRDLRTKEWEKAAQDAH